MITEFNNSTGSPLQAAYGETRRRWLRYLQFITGCDAAAEDALHDSWLHALADPTSGGAPQRLQGGGIVTERVGIVALRYAHRSRRRMRRECLGNMESADANCSLQMSVDRAFEDRSAQGDFLQILQMELKSLPGHEASLILQKYFDCKPTLMIANDAGITAGAVLSRLKRTRAKLRRAIERRMQQKVRYDNEHGATPRIGRGTRRS
ncbi:MAG: RNA polymerase sigma factor [Planctomycetota bacterium]